MVDLGAGFAFVGRQVHIEVGSDDFYMDSMFYHLKLRCVVVELKAGAFKPEHAGQLGFYLSAVDSQVKAEQDNPTIGLLLCKSKNRVVAEYALRDSNKPIGVAEYQLMEALPAELQTSLPSIEQIERELAGNAEALQRRKSVTFCHGLKRQALVSELRESNCADAEGKWQFAHILTVKLGSHRQLKKSSKKLKLTPI